MRVPPGALIALAGWVRVAGEEPAPGLLRAGRESAPGDVRVEEYLRLGRGRG